MSDFMLDIIDGQTELVKELLTNHGENPNERDRGGCSALWWAAAEGHLEIAKTLIDQGADLEAEDKTHNYTPLVVAAGNGHIDLVGVLIERKANLEACGPQKFTPLRRAVFNGKADVAKLLLDKGAKKNVKDVDGKEALDYAITRKHYDIITLLTSSALAFYWACHHNEVEVVRTMIEKRANVNDVTDKKLKFTPLLRATFQGNADVVDLLLKAGADKEASNHHRIRAHSTTPDAGARPVAEVLTFTTTSASQWTRMASPPSSGRRSGSRKQSCC